MILTIIQHATEDQIQRWVPADPPPGGHLVPAVQRARRRPDAAGVKTKATGSTAAGWSTGQKVWTSGAHLSATASPPVRTNPDVPKHEGITIMVIDMEDDGVTVRP